MGLDVIKVCDGLGIGEGSISGASVADDAGPDIMKQVDDAIASPAILVDISKDDDGHLVDDDGCGDGRITKIVMRGREPLHLSLNRAKVFGGGSAMTVADLFGSGEADDTLLGTFQKSIDVLAEHMLNFGAHTADHVSSPEKCGCGAIDEAPVAIARAVKYRADIEAQFAALGVSTDGLDVVFGNFEKCAERFADQTYHGTDVMNLIIDRGKIVKQLGGVHVEARVILNFVKDKTVDQGMVHSISDGKADVFGVDVWRMQELADALHPNDKSAQVRAFQSMLVYTLAVAAVLTKGDLPVYAIKLAEARDPAQALA